MSNEAIELSQSICIMLRQRAARGNPQSKHGSQAAYEWEVYNFVEALDEWLTRREDFRPKR